MSWEIERPQPRVPAKDEPIVLRCPVCGGECRSLAREWRGFNLEKPCCPECANKIAQRELKNGAA